MTMARERRLEELFHLAAAVAGAVREELIARECGSDDAMGAELRAMLQQLEQSTPGCLRPQIAPPAVELPEPLQIGRYRLLKRIGEGGMGVVYTAEQTEPVQRVVALKVMRAGMDTAQALQRFAMERQALALMDHPNIARIHDAGATDAGRPFYVMEYTPGPCLTAYCDHHRLAIDARIRLFIAVCEAVQHAHQRGVIHRDLKPSNVLVGDANDAPLPKVIDFGIARPANLLQHGEAPTQTGDVVGTLDYMSPEQSLGGADVDTRTDIYSLGVMLCELLAGVLPFASERLSARPIAQVQTFLQQAEPRRPSTLVAEQKGAAGACAARRATDASTLLRRLRGDLDWIVLKAMARERERRYASASELAADLRRHLAHEPVLAGPPGARYRCGKFVRRHRGAVLAALALVLTIGGGFVATLLAMRQARAAEDREVVRAEALRRQLYATNVTLAQEAIDRGDAESARELLRGCPDDLRGFEWHYLLGMHDQSRASTVLAADDHGANCAVLHPDGHRLLVGCKSGKIALVDPEQGVVVARYPAMDSPVVHLATDAARQRLLVGSETGSWSLLDASSLVLLQAIASPLDEARWATLSPDGLRVAILRGDQSLQLLDIATGARIVCDRPARPVELGLVAFHPSGAAVVAAGADLCVWSDRGTLLHDLAEPRRHWQVGEHPALQARVFALAFSADGRRLAAGIGHAQATSDAAGNRVELRDTERFELEQMLPMPGRGKLQALALAPDGLQLAAACGRTLVLTNLGGAWRQQRLSGPPSEVLAIVFHTDGASFLSIGNEGVKAWPRYPIPAPDMVELAAPWGRLVWSADRRRLAVPAWALGGSVVYDTETFDLLRAFLPPKGPRHVLAFVSESECVVGKSDDGGVGIFRLDNGAQVCTLDTPAPLLLACVEPVRGLCSAATGTGAIHSFDLAGGRLLATAAGTGVPVQELFAAGTDELVVVRADGSIEVRTASTLALTHAARTGGQPAAAALDRERKRLFVIHTDGGLWRCGLADGMAAERLGQVPGERHGLDVSTDGRRLLVLANQHAQVRDAGDGRVLLPALLGGPAAASVVFRPDGCGALAAGQHLGAWEFGTPEATVENRAAVVRGRGAFLRLKVQHGTNAAMRAHASSEPLDPAARAVLDRTLDRFGDSPYELNHEAWFRVLRPYLAPADYRLAVRAAETAVAALPRREFRNTLATAWLRAGEFERAENLARNLLQEAEREQRPPDPIDLSVLTMAQARRGNLAGARSSLATLRTLTQEPANIQDAQAWIFIHEAEATMAGR